LPFVLRRGTLLHASQKHDRTSVAH
jgi:hypothetical protein